MLPFLVLVLILLVIVFWFKPAPQFSLPQPAGTYILYIEPEAGKQPVLDALNSAQNNIRIVVYNLTDKDVKQAMKDLVQRGVTVRLMIEDNPYGGSSRNIDVGNEMMAAGVKVKWSPKFVRYLHEKSIIVDNKVAYIMTGNLTTSMMTANREYILSTDIPSVVKEITRVYEADWTRERVNLRNSALVWSPDNARPRLVVYFRNAKRSIWLEEQNSSDPEVLSVLSQACKRGVDVRLVTSVHFPIEDDYDEPGRAQLRKAGCQVRYIDSPYVHAKVFVIDGKMAFIGSENLTSNSLDNNRELGIPVYDQSIVQKMQAQFLTDWEKGREEAVPKNALAIPPEGYVDHRQAMKYLYRDDVPIRLTVKSIYKSNAVTWLMGDNDQDTNFKAVIFPSDYSKFPEEPAKYFNGKTIQVTGLIKIYRGWPEIIVKHASQIKIVNK